MYAAGAPLDNRDLGQQIMEMENMSRLLTE